MKSLVLGVLVCDAVKLELQDIAGDYPEMFTSLFRDHTPHGFSISLQFYDVRTGEYPQNLTDCDAYLTTGSAASVNDDEDWIRALEAFMRQLHHAQAKLFAICFGHQAIAKALGGKVAIAEQGWGVGPHRATILQPQAWMIPAVDSFVLNSSHQEQVTELPPNATVVASTPHCPVSMLRCGSLVGIQGHPEFRAPYARALMDSRSHIISESVQSSAAAEFEKASADHSLLASWIAHFASL